MFYVSVPSLPGKDYGSKLGSASAPNCVVLASLPSPSYGYGGSQRKKKVVFILKNLPQVNNLYYLVKLVTPNFIFRNLS